MKGGPYHSPPMWLYPLPSESRVNAEVEVSRCSEIAAPGGVCWRYVHLPAGRCLPNKFLSSPTPYMGLGWPKGTSVVGTTWMYASKKRWPYSWLNQAAVSVLATCGDQSISSTLRCPLHCYGPPPGSESSNVPHLSHAPVFSPSHAPGVDAERVCHCGFTAPGGVCLWQAHLQVGRMHTQAVDCRNWLSHPGLPG